MNDISDNDIAMPLDRPAQLAVIGHCMMNVGFLRSCSKVLHKNHIPDTMVSTLYDMIASYYIKYQMPPTMSEIESIIYSQWSDPSTTSKYRALLYEAVELHAKNFRLQPLKDKLSMWIKVRTMISQTAEITSKFNKTKNIADAERNFTQMTAKLKEAGFEAGNRVDMGNVRQIFSSVVVDRDKACTLGHPEFDEIVMKDSKIYPSDPRYDQSNLTGLTKGCLLPGEQTVVIGPSNTGKTTMLTTVAVSNIAMGKRVCYIGCEDPKDKMVMKFMQSFYEMRLGDFKPGTPEFEAQAADWAKVTSERLYYYEWIKPGKMYVEDVIEQIEDAQELVLSKDVANNAKNPRGFDLLIVDYPGLLMSRDFGRGKDLWAEKQYVYYQFRMLAKKHEFHSLVPIQTNREGYKINHSAESVIELGDVAQGFAITNDADNVITINRNPSDHKLRRIKFYVAKTRSAEAKRTFVSETAYELGRTHGKDFGYAIFDSGELDKLNDDEEMMRRLKRNKTQQYLEDGDRAYNPPADKVQEKSTNSTVSGAIPSPTNAPPVRGAIPPLDIPQNSNGS